MARPDERPAGEAKPNVCAISDAEAEAYCAVGFVFCIYIETIKLGNLCLRKEISL